jgi:hypothetical protein
MANARTTLLCAVRFWGVEPGVATLRRGARHVARKQGVTPRELDKAERSLVKGGLVSRPRAGEIALTGKGVTVSSRACRNVELPPWDAPGKLRRR